MKRIFKTFGLVCLAVSVHAQDGPGWLRMGGVASLTVPASMLASGSMTAKMVQQAVGAPNCANSPVLQTGKAVHSEAITPEITALAKNLENDPVRIYDYVHNYIKYVHYFGSKKGALLTLFEGSGNDFDQCALLVALLRAAASNLGTPSMYTAHYQFGVMEMPYHSANNNDLQHWLGLTLNEASDYSNYLACANLLNILNLQRGYPNYAPNSGNYVFQPMSGGYGDPINFAFHRVWVKLTYADGTTYCRRHHLLSGSSLQNLDTYTGIECSRDGAGKCRRLPHPAQFWGDGQQ